MKGESSLYNIADDVPLLPEDASEGYIGGIDVSGIGGEGEVNRTLAISASELRRSVLAVHAEYASCTR